MSIFYKMAQAKPHSRQSKQNNHLNCKSLGDFAGGDKLIFYASGWFFEEVRPAGRRRGCARFSWIGTWPCLRAG